MGQAKELAAESIREGPLIGSGVVTDFAPDRGRVGVEPAFSSTSSSITFAVGKAGSSFEHRRAMIQPAQLSKARGLVSCERQR